MAKKKDNGKSEIRVPPIEKVDLEITIRGISPLIQHRWSEKARGMMRDKHAGKKTKTRDVRDPQAEGEGAAYKTADGRYGIPAMAFKNAIIDAAHIDMGIAKTVVRKSLFIRCEDPDLIVAMECEDPIIREDVVRVGQNQADLRYRPQFTTWSARTRWTLDLQWLKVEELVKLFDRAGFGIGIGEMRPEKGGECGRFEVETVKTEE